jgi:hypothetical protein
VPRRVSLIEVPGKAAYDNSRARNLALRAAQALHPGVLHVLSLDCDVVIRDSAYFRSGPLCDERTFHRGDVLVPGPGVSKLMHYASRLKPLRTLSNCGLIGSFRAPLDLLKRVNGFDERMSGYGFFDSDLYARLASLDGVRELKIGRGVLHHQPHAARTQNYREKDQGASMRRNARIVRENRWDTTYRQEPQRCLVNGEEAVL